MDKQEMLDRAVVGLFRQKCATFLSVIYCGLKVVWTDEIPTACVDGLTLSINEDWYRNMSPGMRVTVLAHELWHIAYFHCDPIRAANKEPERWNVAADHAINLMLKEHGYEFSIDHLADEIYTDMSAEQIYAQLPESEVVYLPFGKDFVATPTPNENMTDVIAVQGLVVRAAVIAQMGNSDEWGDMPGSLKTAIQLILSPPLQWDVLLSKFLTEISDRGYTWRRPNRRFQDIYLPSRGGEEGLTSILFGFDVSYSVTNGQIGTFLAQCKHVFETFKPEWFEIATFDHQLQETFTLETADQLNEMMFTGRGGTLPQPLLDYAKAKRTAALVVFTDMGFEYELIEDPGLPVLWICLDNLDAEEPPFGRMVHLDTATLS